MPEASVISAFIKAKSNIISQSAQPEDVDELTSALAERTKANIELEIREKYKQEIIAEAQKEIEKERDKQQIREIRKLMWAGFFVAFLVGLAVNQVTEIIAYLKGDSTTIWVTVLISVVLLLICIGIYLYSFLNDVKNYFDHKSK